MIGEMMFTMQIRFYLRRKLKWRDGNLKTRMHTEFIKTHIEVNTKEQKQKSRNKSA